MGLYWYAMSGRYVSTENAYVKSDIVAISPDIDGRVVTVEVVENQLVRQGDVLFRIDPEPYRIALDMAEAKVLAVRHDIEGCAPVSPDPGRDRRGRRAGRLLRAPGRRQRELQERGIAAEVRLDEAEIELMAARQRVPALRRRSVPCSPSVGRRSRERRRASPPLSAKAEAERNMAAFDLDDSVVRAPVDGIVSRMLPGTRGNGSRRASRLQPDRPGDTWIEANLKETQLEHVAVGQKVAIEVDAYPGPCGTARSPASAPRPAPNSR